MQEKHCHLGSVSLKSKWPPEHPSQRRNSPPDRWSPRSAKEVRRVQTAWRTTDGSTPLLIDGPPFNRDSRADQLLFTSISNTREPARPRSSGKCSQIFSHSLRQQSGYCCHKLPSSIWFHAASLQFQHARKHCIDFTHIQLYVYKYYTMLNLMPEN